VTEDLLQALLRTALAEKSLDAQTLPRFAAALRARAEQILAERLMLLEERAASLEKECAWRAEVVGGLEKEKEHWIAEADRRQKQIEELKHERERLIDEKRTTSEAHDRLLAHHRATLLRLAETLESIPPGLPWSYRRVRARIAELLETLRKEAP
jgi:chromosome segregation ATPase